MVVGRDSAPWTIDELGERVARALAHGYAGPQSGRVRAIPDQRTIRYYSTLGLIDPPAQMRGRTALYGHRHLLQLVAIKRLQALDRSLAEIQEALTGVTDEVLARIAEVPEDVASAERGGAIATATAEGDRAPAAPARREGSFWLAAPADVAHDARPAQPSLITTFAGIPLGDPKDQITLLFVPNRQIEEQDLEAVLRAAAPLIEELQHRGLIGPRTSDEGDPR